MAARLNPVPQAGQLPPVRGSVCELEITDLAQDGRGVARADGKVVFVADALPGELARVLRRRRNRQFDEARLLEILRPAPERVAPRCPHFGVCGGCALQHCSGAAQLDLKQRHLRDTFQRIAQLEPAQWLAPLHGPAWGYRRRARLGVKYVAKKQRVLIGFREREGHHLADLQSCDVLHPTVGTRLPALAQLIGGLTVRGQIPQIELAVADNAVALVLRVLSPPTAADRERLLAFGREHGLWFYLQPGGLETIRPLADDTPELYYDLPRHALRIFFNPCDFVQINAEINAELVDLALELLDPQPRERVLELFSGLGNFSLPLAQRASEVVAVEGEAGLVERARRNAEHNGLVQKIGLHAADLSAPSKAEWARESYDKLLLDPPRAGAAEILPQAVASRPRRIVYISCHPATLARDAGSLVRDAGYRLTQAGVIDMFPHTHHVEAIAVFEHG